MSDVGGPKINLLLVEVSKSNQLQPESLLLIGESHSLTEFYKCGKILKQNRKKKLKLTQAKLKRQSQKVEGQTAPWPPDFQHSWL